MNHVADDKSYDRDDKDMIQEALARHDNNPRTRARDDMDMERLLKVFVTNFNVMKRRHGHGYVEGVVFVVIIVSSATRCP